MSILFLLVDDGGFQLGLYDDNVTATPNIDALGRRSGAVIYDNTYTAVSSCSPSRPSLAHRPAAAGTAFLGCDPPRTLRERQGRRRR